MTYTPGTAHRIGLSGRTGRRPIVLAVLTALLLALTGLSPFVHSAQAATLLSQGKPTTASTVESATFASSMAVDGNTGTRWASAFSDAEWIQVDLGSSQSISQVVLNWEAAYGKSFQIQTSSAAGGPWTNIYTTTTGTGGVQTLNVTGTGQFVRMNGTLRGSPYGYSLFEFQVYGGGAVVVTGNVIAAPGGKCVDMPGNDTAGNGAIAQLWDCLAAAVDQHYTASAGQLKTLGRCLDITGNGTANLTKVDLWDCNTNAGQLWTQTADGSLKNPASGRCLDSPSGATANGTQLQIYDCNQSPAQKFSIAGGTGLSVGGTGGVSATSTIQAEAYQGQAGTITETTTDTGGGQNIGAIGNGDWLQYNSVNFGTAGLRTFSARVASGAAAGVSGSVEVHLDALTNPSIGSFSIANTGGWQSWRTTPAAISTTTGTHTVFLKFVTGAGADFVNVNWLTFS